MKKGLIIWVMAIIVVMSGCKKQDVKKEVDMGEEGEEIETVSFNEEGGGYREEPSVRGEREIDEKLKTVYFEFDRSDLTRENIEILKENAEYLSKREGLKIVVEGDTDNRGTAEYNLALGQRRALKVKDYYVKYGIEGSRIGTISYGSEKPEIDEDNEIAWSKNRRAETKVIKR